MSREQQLRAAEARENTAKRIRARFGLPTSGRAEGVRDWLTGPGAVPAAIAALALVGYGVVSVIAALGGG